MNSQKIIVLALTLNLLLSGYLLYKVNQINQWSEEKISSKVVQNDRILAESFNTNQKTKEDMEVLKLENQQLSKALQIQSEQIMQLNRKIDSL